MLRARQLYAAGGIASKKSLPTPLGNPAFLLMRSNAIKVYFMGNILGDFVENIDVVKTIAELKNSTLEVRHTIISGMLLHESHSGEIFYHPFLHDCEAKCEIEILRIKNFQIGDVATIQSVVAQPT